MIIVAPRIIKFLCKITGDHDDVAKHARAMALFPFILVRSREVVEPWLINHEKIHFRQELEGLLLFTLLFYQIEKFYARHILKLPPMEAYLYISAEQEAYLNQNNPDYLKSRPLFRQWYYLTHKKKFTLDKNSPGKLNM